MRQHRRPHGRTLRVETLENRALLSVSAIAGSVSFQDFQFTATGAFTGNVKIGPLSVAGAGTATITGNIQYTSATAGSGSLGVSGSLTSPAGASGTAVDGSAPLTDSNGKLKGTFKVSTSSGDDFGGACAATLSVAQGKLSTISVPRFTLPLNGITEKGSNGKIVVSNFQETSPTNGTFGVTLGTPAWGSSTGTSTLTVPVTVTGGLDLSKETAMAATVKLQFASVQGTNPASFVGTSLGTIDIAWNQAEGTYQFTGVPTTLPTGATELVLITTINGTVQPYTPVALPTT